MKNAGAWLQKVLRFNAVMLMLGFVAMILPAGWMDDIHRALGLGPLPEAPLLGYLSRAQALLYGIAGVFTWIIAGDIQRYRTCIRFWALASITAGLCLLVIGWYEEMPVFWLLCEGPYLIPLGIGLLGLLKLCDQA